MNCQTVPDKLIDLIYGELHADERAAVEEHLAACPACRGERDRLLFARSAVGELLARGPAAQAFDVAAAAAAGRHAGQPARLRWRRWLPRGLAVGAAAAAVVVAFGAWLLHETSTPPAIAKAQPPEIRRIGLSLTILSQPEGWAAADMQQGDPQSDGPMQMPPMPQAQVQTEEEGQMTVQTLNAPPYWGGEPIWRGMALVRDQRLVRNLPQGRSTVCFADVPSGILPDTVRLRSLMRPDGMAILEQNYQYDLASAEAVLRKHVDRPVTALFKDGQSVAGALLSFDGRTLVIRPDGEGPRSIERQQLRSIAFARLPEGLLTRPTLVWELANRAEAKQQFEVAYLTGGLTWRADYVLKLRPAATPARPVEDGDRRLRGEQHAASEPAPILDSADLVGYATVNNFSGVSYENAQLKLMAGDVNLIKPPERTVYFSYGPATEFNVQHDVPVMTEKSFFEYHLYTVTRPTTIRHAETKQLEMVSGSGLRLRRGYVYDPQDNPTAARVVSELANSEANGLGKPLPKGVVRLYAPDPEGQQAYVSDTTIDHTPKDEKLRLPWGCAFDIACSAVETATDHRGDDHGATWRYEVRNHKDCDVNVTVMVRVPPSTYRAACEGFRWHVRQVGLVEIDVPVRASAAATVTFSYRWNPASGGGLKSPGGAAGGADPDR